jgi:general secretion pathway protein F
MTGLYRYSAFAAGGDVVTGTIEAHSQADALKLIHDRGMLAFEAVEAQAAEAAPRKSIREWFSPRLALAGRVALTRSLATLLNADIAIDQSLRILAESNANQIIRRIVQHCAECVAAGQTLSEALKSSGSGFRADELAMIAAGEENGSLAQVLDQLAKLLERRLDLSRRLASALVYPALLVVMAIGSIFVIITVLIPNIEPLFEGNDAQLPAVVSVLLAIRDVLERYWMLIALAVAASGAGIVALLRSPGSRPVVDRLALRLPLIGGLVRQSIVSRICLTLATLLQSGVPLQQSLAAITHVAHNHAARAIVDHALEQVVTGARLSRSLSGNALFDDPSLRLIALGEETNRLHQMLHHIAATTEAHVMRQVERAMTLLTPVLTLVLGGMVGGIIMSVMQAILSINEIAIR